MARSTGGRKHDAPRQLTFLALVELFQRAGPRQSIAGTSAYTLDHLRRFFRRRLPTSSTIVDYVRRRQEDGAAVQTINDELWSLAWMFKCALRQDRLKQEECPRIEFLKEPRRPLDGQAQTAQIERDRDFIAKVTGRKRQAPAAKSRRNTVPPGPLKELRAKWPGAKPGKLSQLLQGQGHDVTRWSVERAMKEKPEP
jgi:hypothetical protein